MINRTRVRVGVALVVALTVLPAEFSVLSGVIGALGDTSDPSEWVRSHATALPQTSVELKSMPVPFRKAIFAALPFADRSRLWRAHFTEYIQEHETLDATQLAVLRDAHALMSPTNLANTDDPGLRAVADDIIDRARTAFSPQDANELFYWFGPFRPARHAVLSALKSPFKLQTFAHLFVLDARLRPNCSCSQEWDCYTLGPTCDMIGGDCEPIEGDWPMCGPLWMYSCDGSSC